MSDELDKMDFGAMKQGALVFVIGPRNGGKTTILLDILSKRVGKHDLAVAMCGTMASAESMRRYFPHNLVHYGFKPDIIEKYIQLNTARKEAGKPLKRIILVFDDLAYDPEFMKSKIMIFLGANGRHLGFEVYMLSQYLMWIPAGMRGLVDVVVTMKEVGVDNQKNLYKAYYSPFGSQKKWTPVFMHYTDNYGALVFDRFVNSINYREIMKWYRADPETPDFMLSRPEFWQLNKVHMLHQEKKAKERQS